MKQHRLANSYCIRVLPLESMQTNHKVKVFQAAFFEIYEKRGFSGLPSQYKSVSAVSFGLPKLI